MSRRAQSESHDVTALVDDLLSRGLEAGATDLHFEPADDALLIRWRIDGHLNDIDTLPKRLADNVLSRLKVLASLLTYRVDIPQEGSLSFPIRSAGRKGETVDLRVATFPTIRGERCVVRVFAGRTELQALDDLGLDSQQCKTLVHAIDQPGGLIVVTGPAGSGKTTTLYALIRHLVMHSSHRSVITLEDPVEQRVDRATQIQINPYGELSYERCMRSLLRQDPQVILIGEVRDSRTASVAIEASLTGHLILTTAHSADPAETVVRFLEMGIAPYQLVSALSLVCSQRLVRRICLSCKAKRTDGCSDCWGTGYSGRIALAQIAMLDEEARRLVLEFPAAGKLRQVFAKQGSDLAERGRTLIDKGVTNDVELKRVIGTGVG